VKTSTEEENNWRKNTKKNKTENRKTNSFASVLSEGNPSLWRHCVSKTCKTRRKL